MSLLTGPSATDEQDRAAGRRRRGPAGQVGSLLTGRFVLLVGSTLAYFVAVGALMATLPLFVRGPLGGGTAAVGVAQGAFYASALVLRPWAGRLADQVGRRPLMVGGAAVAAASVAAYGSTTGMGALVGLRLLTGVGEASFLVGAMAAASDMAPPARRGEAMSLLSVGIYGGVALGPSLGENVLASAGFATVWLVAAAAAAIAAVGALGKETLVAGRATGGAGSVLHRAALVPGMVLAASAWSLAGFNALIALHARQVGLSGAGQVFALFAIVVLSVRIAGASIPDRLGPRLTARAALATTALGMALMGAGSTPSALLTGTVLFALGQSLAFPGLAALAVGRVGPSERGAVFATMTAFLDLAFGMGALTLGALAGRIGLGGAFLVSAVIAAAGGLALAGPERRRSAHRTVRTGRSRVRGPANARTWSGGRGMRAGPGRVGLASTTFAVTRPGGRPWRTFGRGQHAARPDPARRGHRLRRRRVR